MDRSAESLSGELASASRLGGQRLGLHFALIELRDVGVRRAVLRHFLGVDLFQHRNHALRMRGDFLQHGTDVPIRLDPFFLRANAHGNNATANNSAGESSKLAYLFSI